MTLRGTSLLVEAASQSHNLVALASLCSDQPTISPIITARITVPLSVMKHVVIVVDDHECIARWIKWNLEQRFQGKIEVVLGCKGNGQAAVAMLEDFAIRGYYQTIVGAVVGYHLAGLSGAQVIASIREMEMKYSVDQSMLVVGCSADLCDENANALVRAGADYVIWEPIDEQFLNAVVEKELLLRGERTADVG
jgi:CheY-like chemotaxis protein